MFLGLLEEGHRAEDAGAVHEYVEAPEALERHVDQPLGRGRRADVAGGELDAIAARIELLARRVEYLLAPARQDD